MISNKSGSNVFRANTFRESAGTITLRHGNDNLVEGNFFLGNNKSQTGGIRVIGEREGLPPDILALLDEAEAETAPNSGLLEPDQAMALAAARRCSHDCQAWTLRHFR